jgi:hypothetical protein
MGFALRAAVLAIAVLTLPAPARGATSLAHIELDGQIALAGDTALFERSSGGAVGVLAVPLDASSRAQTRLSVPDHGGEAIVYLSGSSQRAAIAITKGDEGSDNVIGQLFSGPPAGPWPALTEPQSSATDAFLPLLPEVDGNTLFVLEMQGLLDKFRETVREPGAAPRVLEDVSGDSLPAFAGDTEAEIAGVDEHTLLIRNWRTGAQRRVDLGDGAQSVDVRPDGTAVVGFDGGGVLRVAPDGTPSVVSRGGEHPRFAGDRIVYADGERLMAVDPGGRPRPVGVPSASLDDFDADERHVLWSARGCLFVADLAAPAAQAPEPGVCTRTELDLDPHSVYLRVRADRTVVLRVRCIAAPGACRGTLRVNARGHAGPALRFSVPAGRRATLTPRLPRTRRGFVSVRPRAVLRDPDGRRTIVARTYGARVR